MRAEAADEVVGFYTVMVVGEVLGFYTVMGVHDYIIGCIIKAGTE